MISKIIPKSFSGNTAKAEFFSLSLSAVAAAIAVHLSPDAGIAVAEAAAVSISTYLTVKYGAMPEILESAPEKNRSCKNVDFAAPAYHPAKNNKSGIF